MPEWLKEIVIELRKIDCNHTADAMIEVYIKWLM